MTALIAITGIGVVSAAGRGSRLLADACFAGRSLLTQDPDLGVMCGRIPYAAGGASALTADALAQACGTATPALDARTGMIFATTTGHMAEWEDALPRYTAGDLPAAAFAALFRQHHLGCSIDDLAAEMHPDAPFQVLTSACAAGTQALVLAYAWLQSGRVDRCLVGATETMTRITARGFDCLGLLAKTPARPFAQGRDGINLGEAAVFLRVERVRAGTSVRARLLGGGTALDAHDLTSPHPDGRGLVRAVRQALNQSGLGAADVDWVHAHGTGTIANDRAEARALAAVFGRDHIPPVTSTKHVHGHALGASGLLETAIVIESLARGMIPPAAGCDVRDPELALPIAQTTLSPMAPPRNVLKTTLGFGGANAAVLIGAEDAP